MFMFAFGIFANSLRYSKLFNLYSPLLSSAQQNVLYDYYFLDLSLSEISENRHISRSAVEDALKKGTNKLDEFEAKLKTLENNEKYAQILIKIREKLSDSDSINEIDKLLEELENGI